MAVPTSEYEYFEATINELSVEGRAAFIDEQIKYMSKVLQVSLELIGPHYGR